MTHWTPEHTAFALQHHLTPAAKLLWQWLVDNQGKSPELEPDLKDFNNWVEKYRGKGYCRDTLKAAIAKLEEAGIVRLVKKFTWNIWRLILRSTGILVNPPKPQKKLLPRKEICGSAPSNPETLIGEDIAAAASNSLDQPQTAILSECVAAGIEFNPAERGTQEVLKHPIEDVRAAIHHFFRRGGHSGNIENPQGWLIECLRRRWWEQESAVISGVINALLFVESSGMKWVKSAEGAT